MARCLIVGCGCRGQSLARELVGKGQVVRGTTRDPDRRSAIEAAGAEAVVADPDRLATLVPALAQVSVVCWLLGSASGAPAAVGALHGERLEMLLSRLVDTTVQGIVYETVGSVGPAVLARGAEHVRRFAEDTRARWARLDADPADPGRWLEQATHQVAEILAPRTR